MTSAMYAAWYRPTPMKPRTNAGMRTGMAAPVMACRICGPAMYMKNTCTGSGVFW